MSRNDIETIWAPIALLVLTTADAGLLGLIAGEELNSAFNLKSDNLPTILGIIGTAAGLLGGAILGDAAQDRAFRAAQKK